MDYAIGAVAGLIWGGLCALLNCFLSLRAIRKNSEKAILGANALRVVVDIAALGSLFLLRNYLPFNAMVALVGTAASLSVITIIFAFKVASGKIK